MTRIIAVGMFFVALVSGAHAADRSPVAAMRWEATLPPGVRAKHRSVPISLKIAEKLFATPVEIQDVLHAWGSPASFSRQSFLSPHGSPSRTGGTLRYKLSDGGDVLIWSGDLAHVHFAFAYPAAGDAVLLFK